MRLWGDDSVAVLAVYTNSLIDVWFLYISRVGLFEHHHLTCTSEHHQIIVSQLLMSDVCHVSSSASTWTVQVQVTSLSIISEYNQQSPSLAKKSFRNLNCAKTGNNNIKSTAVPDFGSGRNPALFPNPAEIRLRQKSHRSRIVLPDLKTELN